jgi:HK97 family phage major capsid protein
MDLQEIKKKIAAAEAAIVRLYNKATSEGRSLNVEEETLVAQLEGTIVANREELSKPLPAVTVGGGSIGGSDNRTKNRVLVPAGQPRNFNTIFTNPDSYRWGDTNIGFFAAAHSGQYNPNFRNAMTEGGAGSDGGFLIPLDERKDILNVAIERSIFLKLANVAAMRSMQLRVPAWVIGDHSSSLFGNVTASWVAEGGTINETSPKSRSMLLNAHKLSSLARYSSELRDDIIGGPQQITDILGQAITWYLDKAFFSGSGAGEPQGLTTCNALVTCDGAIGQGEGTLIFDNLASMMGRLYTGSWKNAVWIASQSTLPSLLQLTIPSGTGGSAIAAFTEGADGTFKLLHRPIYFTEHLPSLGNKGDILLCDLSNYIVGMRQEVRYETSIHTYFTSDELVSRATLRADGQSLWNEPLKLASGDTVSPFVTLAARE